MCLWGEAEEKMGTNELSMVAEKASIFLDTASFFNCSRNWSGLSFLASRGYIAFTVAPFLLIRSNPRLAILVARRVMRFEAVLLVAHRADKNVGSVWSSWCSYFIHFSFSVKLFLYNGGKEVLWHFFFFFNTCLDVRRFSQVQLRPVLGMCAKLRHGAATSNLEDVNCEEVCCCCCCWLGVPPCECLL